MVVLIDYENVNSNGLQGITKLSKDDLLYIFYNDASKISFDIHRSIEKIECEKRYQKITSKTANALDFLLVTILGDLIANDSESVYVIVSNDTGFDVVVKYWKSKNVDIFRYSSINSAANELIDDTTKLNTEIETSVEKEPQTTEEKVEALFSETKKPLDVDKKIIANYIDKYKTKSGLNNALCKTFGSNITGEINKIIKPLIKDKKGR